MAIYIDADKLLNAHLTNHFNEYDNNKSASYNYHLGYYTALADIRKEIDNLLSEYYDLRIHCTPEALKLFDKCMPCAIKIVPVTQPSNDNSD